MASAKRSPKVSKISRERTVAYARKDRPAGAAGDDSTEEAAVEPLAPAAASAGVAAGAPGQDAPAPGRPEATSSPAIAPPPPARAAAAVASEPPRTTAPAAASESSPAVGKPAPARGEPRAAKPAVAVEDPTWMPGPRDVPMGSAGDLAAPPGLVPAGDSRSLRRTGDTAEFALVYRIQTYVITRVGVVGTRGEWRVVEYPTSASASHSYAKQCSHFVSEGFSDYRA
jgi:hypothetical protein